MNKCNQWEMNQWMHQSWRQHNGYKSTFNIKFQSNMLCTWKQQYFQTFTMWHHMVGANSTLICSLPTNKHYKLCTQIHLIFIQSIVPNNSNLFLDYIHTFISLLLLFHYFPNFGLLLIIWIGDHILIIIVKKTQTDSKFTFIIFLFTNMLIFFFTQIWKYQTSIELKCRDQNWNMKICGSQPYRTLKLHIVYLSLFSSNFFKCL